MDLPLRFFFEGEHYVLVESKDAAWLDDGDIDEVGPWETQRVRTGALAQGDAHGQLRASLGGQTTGSGWDDHHGLSRRIRTRIDEDPERLMLMRRRRPSFALVFGDPVVDDLSDLVPGDDHPEDTWIEVLVVDEEDVPIAGIDYEIELSDGRVRRGRTSEHGILRYDDMPPGSCKVKLLGVEAKGWDRA